MLIYIATTNKNKRIEIENLLKEHLPKENSIVFKTIDSLSKDLQEKYNPEENAETFQGNAFIKARALHDLTGENVIAEDSGLEVFSLDKRPGVFSSRYAPTDKERIEKLLNEIKTTEDNKRAARFVTCLCFIDKFENPVYFFGKTEGLITHEPKGDKGFGYDPVFYYEPLKKTFAEMTLEEKQSVSHRGKALRLFLNYLSKTFHFFFYFLAIGLNFNDF
ncbi:MAG: RdgB/HAM1 family non-canonical purine NTP pyrophosphatase [Spirochaetia bacterium]|nr:RdgB/HAM1 family non-canonical purine NTP pyrophosphatase [Spirochaetia bacterium]